MRKLIPLLLLSLPLSVSAASTELERIEPANWWVGMNNPKVQVTLYGENIGHLRPTLTAKGVTIQKTVSVENPNYLFLYLNIGKDVDASVLRIDLKDNKNVVTTIDFPLLARNSGSKNREGFNTSDVMYLVTPDRFANGDETNDSLEYMPDKLNRSHNGGRHGGDIEGLRQSLDYLDDMGFTAVWLNPVLENNMPSYSYHGYAITDLYKVDARYGSNEEYKEFINEAHDKDIKVIMDMIMNHVGSEHWFVNDRPTSDWLNYDANYVRTSHHRNTVQDPYASEDDKKQFSDGWFVQTMPDLNQRNELLADYLIQNTIWWVEYSGLDGIRMDTYPYPDKNFMGRWTCEVMAEYPNFNIVGEEWTSNPAIVSYWQGGKTNHDGYTSCLPSLMDFPIQEAMANSLKKVDDNSSDDFDEAYRKLTLDFLYSDPSNLVVFPDNHDMERFYSQMGNDLARFQMGINYFLTIRGIPQIFYGTEVLMPEAGGSDHGHLRADFPGGWSGDKINAFTGKGLSDDQKNTQMTFKKLLNWRKNKDVIHNGKLMHYAPENGVYVFFRYNDEEKVMVVMNKNEKATSINVSRFEQMIENASSATDVLTGKKQSLKTSLSIPAMTTSIFELK